MFAQSLHDSMHTIVTLNMLWTKPEGVGGTQQQQQQYWKKVDPGHSGKDQNTQKVKKNVFSVFKLIDVLTCHRQNLNECL